MAWTAPRTFALPRHLLFAAVAVLLALAGCSGDKDGPRTATLTGFLLTPQSLPMAGARVATLNGQREAFTNENGRFELVGIPVGSGGTQTVPIVFNAEAASPPSTFELRMDFALTPGRVTQLEGPMYIPMSAPGEGTVIHGLSDQTVYTPEHPGASLQIPAGSVDFNKGRGPQPQNTGTISMVYMPREQMPGPMPGGQISDVVFSIQPSGIVFDEPVPVTFPNYDRFLPGEVVPVMQMNPATAQWEEVAQARVNSAATLIETLPGQGVLWGSCTGCCYPPCFASWGQSNGAIGGRVEYCLYDGTNTIRLPVGGATVRIGTRTTTTNAAGVYVLENVPIGNCNQSQGPFNVVVSATWANAQGTLLKTTKTVQASSSQILQTDLMFECFNFALLDDWQDGREYSDETSDSADPRVVTALAVDGYGHVRLKPTLPFSVGPQDQIRVYAVEADGPQSVRIAYDAHLGDGSPGNVLQAGDWKNLKPIDDSDATLRVLAPKDFGDPDFFNRVDGRERRTAEIMAEIRRPSVSGSSYEVIAVTPLPVSIELVRPPVFLVHGIQNSRDKWANSTPNNSKDLTNRGNVAKLLRQYNGATPYDLFTADYEEIHMSTLLEVVPIVEKQLRKLVADQRDSRAVSTSRVDVIGHSYGGLIAREIIAQAAAAGAVPRVRRLATLGTPHLGASMADRHLNIAELSRSNDPGGIRALDNLLTWMDRAQGFDPFSQQTYNAIGAEALHDGSDVITAYGELAVAHRTQSDYERRGFVPSVEYRFFYTDGGIPGLFDIAYGVLGGWGSGVVERGGDYVVSQDSGSAGYSMYGVSFSGSGLKSHGELANLDIARQAFPFLSAPPPQEPAIPSPELAPRQDATKTGPVITGFNTLSPDWTSTDYVFEIYGKNLTVPGVTSIEVRFPVVRDDTDPSGNPILLFDEYRRVLPVDGNFVTPDRIRFEAPANPLPPATWPSGWVNPRPRAGDVTVVRLAPEMGKQRETSSNRVRVYFAPRANPAIHPPTSTVAGAVNGAALVVDVEHDAPVLVEPLALLSGVAVAPRSVQLLGPAGNGRMLSRVALDMPDDAASGDLTIVEGPGGGLSPSVAVSLDPEVLAVNPVNVRVGETVKVEGRHLGWDIEEIQVFVGATPQVVTGASGDSVFAVVATGTTTDSVRVVHRGISSADGPTLLLEPDTDRDGLPDSWEQGFGLDFMDPADALSDSDGDGLANGSEFSLGTRPDLSDTDGGGVNDGTEVGFGLDPLNGADDSADSDGDGLNTPQELTIGTHPGQFDSDGDGLSDGQEFTAFFGFATDPTAFDTDGDGLSDGVEVLTLNSNPLMTDTDGDGLSDGSEYATYGSSPVLADTDGDGLLDGVEVAAGTDPTLEDTDDDGLDDGEELAAGTSALDPDSDDDGLTDGLEVGLGTSPLLADPVTTFEGRVLLSGGAPAAGARVQVLGTNFNLFGVLTGSDGTFELGPWPAVLSPVQIAANFNPGNLNVVSAALATVPGGITAVGDLVLPGGLVTTTLVGRVVDLTASAVADATVTTNLGGQATTDSLGTFALPLSFSEATTSVDITAVATIQGVHYIGLKSYGQLVPSGMTDVGDIIVSVKEPCQLAWVRQFGSALSLLSGLPGALFASSGPDTGLYVSGNLSVNVPGWPQNALTGRWDGQFWSPVGGFVGDISDFVMYDSGNGSGPVLYGGGASGVKTWDGMSWLSLGSEVVGGVRALAVFDDRSGTGPSLFAAGSITSAGGLPANGIAKWDGSNWAVLGAGLAGGSVEDLAVFDDGSGAGEALYAAGSFTSAGGALASHIAKWDGSSWHGLDTGLSHQAFALTVYDDGGGFGPALYVGGNFVIAGGVMASKVARWDGSSWWALGPGVTGSVRTLEVFDDGIGSAPSLYVGGSISTAGGVSTPGVARWNGTVWSGVGSGLLNGIVGELEVFDDGSGVGPVLYAAGDFTSPAVGFARWDGTSWSRVASRTALRGPVNALKVHDDGSGAGRELYAGGNFTEAGFTPASRIASWNGTMWSPLGAGLNGPVSALEVFDSGTGVGPALYAAGNFNNAGNASARSIARWNGSTWSPLGAGVIGDVRALAVYDDMSGSGPSLYVGGAFTTAGGAPASNIAKWDGASWSQLGSGVTGFVFALAVHDDGSGPNPNLYVAGNFTFAGNAPANRIAKWDGIAWSPVGVGFDAAVRALVVYDDGTGGGASLYAGGDFSHSGGVQVGRVAKWNGTIWSAFGAGLDSGFVQALAVHDRELGSGQVLYAAGNLNIGGLSTVAQIAFCDGTTWTAIDSQMNAPVAALLVHKDGAGQGASLYAGGQFTRSESGDSYLARWACGR